MKQIALYFYSSILGLVFLSSCSYSPQNEPSKFIDVDDEIELNILENLTEENSYFLTITTIKSDLCSESRFITQYSSTNEKVQWDIQGLEIPSDCSNFESNVISNESFDFTEGSRLIELTIANNLTNKIYLEKNENQIDLIHNDLKGLIYSSNKLLSIKQNYLWGGVYPNSDLELKQFNELIETIEKAVQNKPLLDGNYGHFHKDEIITSVNPYNFMHTNYAFALEVSSDIEIINTEIPAIVLDFKMNHPELDFYIVSGDGMTY